MYPLFTSNTFLSRNRLKLENNQAKAKQHVTHFEVKGVTKSYRKIIFVSATKIGKTTTNILNRYFSS